MSRQTGTDERTVTPAEAATVLERPAVWPGPSVDGVELTRIEVMNLKTEWSNGRETRGRALVFQYGPARRAGGSERWLILTEGTSREETPRFGSFGGPNVAAGALRLVGVGDLDGSDADMWFGSMEMDGVYIVLESRQREVVLRAARAMAPIR